MHQAYASRPRLVPAVSALVAITLSLTFCKSSAQNPPGLGPTEHQETFRAVNGLIFGGGVQLSDQFHPGLDSYGWQGPLYLSAPASKNGEQVDDLVTHYAWYDLFSPFTEPERNVLYINQFGTLSARVTDARYLVVPTLKNPTPGQVLRPDVNHFKCYTADGPPLNQTVTLQTQFGAEQVVLGKPILFCNPAEKVYERAWPIAYPQDHFVCYEMTPLRNVIQQVLYINQFVNPQQPTPTLVLDSQWFCVPSLKTGVTATQKPTWGQLKSIYR